MTKMSYHEHNTDKFYNRRNAYVGEHSLNNPYKLPSMYSHTDANADEINVDFNDSSSDDEVVTNAWQHSVEKCHNLGSAVKQDICPFTEPVEDLFRYGTRGQRVETRQNYLDRYKEQLKQKEAEERRRQLLTYPNPRLAEQKYDKPLPFNPYEMVRREKEQQRLQLQNQPHYQIFTERYNMPILKYKTVGNDIVFTNFNECLEQINRINMKKFVLEFIKLEFITMKLEVNIIKKNKKITIMNCHNALDVQSFLEKYIDNYVRCKRCRSYDTVVNITKNSRRKFYISNCKKCKAIFPIKHYIDI